MSEMVNQIIEYIEDRLSGNLEYVDMYRDIGYSKYHLTREFRTKTGYTISEYYLKRRLSEAALEISNSKSKIIDISYKYGFNSDSYFSRKFRIEFGISPREYRNRKCYIVITNKILMKEKNNLKYTSKDDLVRDILVCSSTEEIKGFFLKSNNCVLTHQNNSQLEIVFILYSSNGLGKVLLTLHLNVITGQESVIPIYEITDQDGDLVEMKDLTYDNDELYVSFIDHNTNITSRAKLIRSLETKIHCNYITRSR